LLTDYTTTLSIRSLLGIAALELTDDKLAEPHFVDEMELEMDDIDSGGGQVRAQYAVISALVESSRSADQIRFLKIAQLFAAYSVAKKLCGSVDMFAPQTIQDGRASHQRTALQAQRMREAVTAGYTLARQRLASALVVLVPAATVPVGATPITIVSTGLATDPVTGA
jgi:hypothetical protein